MPLNVTYVTLPAKAGGRRQNVGDRVIHLGVRNIMRCAIGGHQAREIDIARGEAIPSETQVLVVCGMPQIAAAQAVGPATHRTAEVASADVPVRINLGAGAFYFDAFGDDRAALDAGFAERVRDCAIAPLFRAYRGFHLCTTRDHAAAAALHMLDVPAIALPCPGFFAPLFQPRPLLRHDQPLIATLNGRVSFWNRVAGDVEAFHHRLRAAHPDAAFLAHDEEDAEMLTDFGIPHLVFDTAEELMACLAAHRRILSLRVHGALPAWSLGLGVTLLGLDRRALLGEDFGARMRVVPLRDEDDLHREDLIADAPMQDEAAREAWLSHHLAAYARAIRGAIEPVLGKLAPFEAPGLSEWRVPRLHAPTGRYRGQLYFSADPEFAVGPDRLRSEHPSTTEGSIFHVTTDGSAGTLLFGPYILIPRGAWRLRLRITLVPPSAGQPIAPELHLSMGKGNPMEMLAEAPIAAGPHGLDTSIDFTNPRDLGLIEVLIRASLPPAPGWRLSVSEMRFERLA